METAEKKKIEDMEVEKASNEKPRYPWFIIFILGNEFCERFTYYGMKTVLTLYLKNELDLSEDLTTFVYHFFSMLCYFLPVIGAWLADGVIGKFRTILWLSLVYILGLVVLTLSAMPPVHFHAIAGCMCGLFLIAFGTGGIKPCVSTYGADQFKPGQEAHRERFFSYFYFCINAGSLISTFVTPLLRSDVHCFGDKTCYSLAFGVPAALMAVALSLFLMGRPFYTDTPVHGSIITRVAGCICRAIVNNIRGRKPDILQRPSVTSETEIISPDHISSNPLKKMQMMWKKRKVVSTTHWLDSSADKYDVEFIGDVKQLLKVLFMFLPIPMFWALFDQQGSRWTLQANRMDGRVTDTYSFQPDQVQIFNPVLILILIPIFDCAVYPALKKLRIPFRLLSRMVVGMVLAGVAFVIAGFLQIAIDKTLPVQPAVGTADLKIFNIAPCELTLSGAFLPNATESLFPSQDTKSVGLATLVPLSTRFTGRFFEPPVQFCGWTSVQMNASAIPTLGGISTVQLRVKAVNCPNFDGFTDISVELKGGKVYGLFLALRDDKLVSEKVQLEHEKPAEANARALFLLPFGLQSGSGDGNITLTNPKIPEDKEGYQSVMFVNGSGSILKSDWSDVGSGPFVLSLSGGHTTNGSSVVGSKQISFPNGGVYVVILNDLNGTESPNSSYGLTNFTIVEPSTVSIFWQFPQYFVITVAEVFLSVSGLTFAYAEAPESMRSLISAAWLLTSAFGSVIVMIISGGHLIKSQAVEFFVFAGLIGIFAIIFAIMSKFYHYTQTEHTVMENPKKTKGKHEKEEEESSSEKAIPLEHQGSREPLTRAEADDAQYKK